MKILLLVASTLVIAACSTKITERLLTEKLGKEDSYQFQVIEFSKSEYSAFLAEKLESFEELQAGNRWRTITSTLCPFGHKENESATQMNMTEGRLSQHKAATILCKSESGELQQADADLYSTKKYVNDVENFSFHYPAGWNLEKKQRGSLAFVSVHDAGSEAAFCAFGAQEIAAESKEAKPADSTMTPAEWILHLEKGGFEKVGPIYTMPATVGQLTAGKAEFEATVALEYGRGRVKAIAYSFSKGRRSYFSMCAATPTKTIYAGVIYSFYMNTFNRVLQSFQVN